MTMDRVSAGYPALDAQPNILINGDFSVWQRGTVFGSNTNGYTADRWGVFSATKVQKAANTPIAGDYGFNSMLIEKAVNADTYMFQRVELPDGAENRLGTYLNGKTITVSFDVYASNGANKIDQVWVLDQPLAHSTILKSDIPLTNNQWNHVEATATLSTFIDGDGSDYFYIRVDLGESSAGTFSFTNFKAEFNSYATPFIPDDHVTNLAKCQRYFVGGLGFAKPVNSVTDLYGQCFAQNPNWIQLMTCHVGMRGVPSVRVSGVQGSIGKVTSWVSGQEVTINSAVLQPNGKMSIYNPTAFTSNEAYGFNYEIDAEL